MRRGAVCCGERGQSESVGIILLVGVVVVLVAGAGAVVIADWQSQAERETQVTVQSNLTSDGTGLTLKHMGGDSLPPEDVLVTVQGADWERTLDNGFTGADRFRAGSRWESDDGPPAVDGPVTVRVFDRSTNTLLHQQTYDRG